MSDSRHDDDAEVQPVPGVSQEGERSHTEPSGQDLDKRLEGVDAGEGVPERVDEEEVTGAVFSLGGGLRGYTYSRYLAQLAGSDMAMKQQLVRMVHMMNKLNKVLKFRRTHDSTDTFSTSTTFTCCYGHRSGRSQTWNRLETFRSR